MLLTVKERLLLQAILTSAHGRLYELRVIQDLQRGLNFDEEELKQLNIHPEGDRIVWNDTLPPKEIEVGDVAHEVIVRTFKELEPQGVLKLEHLEIIEDKFPEVEQ